MYEDRPWTSGIAPAGGGACVTGVGRSVAARTDSTTSLRPSRRPSTAAPAASTASDPAEIRNRRRESPPAAVGSASPPVLRRPRRSRWRSPNSVPMPAAAATIAATTPTHAVPCGSSRYENMPTAPKARKPTTPTTGRRTDALPSTAPRASDTTTMPVIRATLSLVPNRAIARSFRDAAKRSMNCVPTAVINDGCEPASPQTSSLAASATPAATTPATAPSTPRMAVAGGSEGRCGSAGDSVATAMPRRYASPATSGARSAQRTRNSARPGTGRPGAGVLSAS